MKLNFVPKYGHDLGSIMDMIEMICNCLKRIIFFTLMTYYDSLLKHYVIAIDHPYQLKQMVYLEVYI